MKQPKKTTCWALLLAAPLLAAGSASAQVCVEPPMGMVSWWPGDGDVSDIKSNRPAELAGDAGYATGLVGDAFALSGGDTGLEDRVILPSEAMDGLGDMTVELWINTVHPYEAGILSGANGAAGGDNEILLFQLQNPTDITLGIQGTTSGRLPVVINDGVWHHLAFTRQAGHARMYVDGAVAASYPVSADPFFIEPGGLMIGQEQDCLAGCFSQSQALTGLVDEVTVYAKALSQDEIWAIANAGAEGKCKPQLQEVVANEELVVRIEQLEYHVGSLIERVTELESHEHSQRQYSGQLWRLILKHLRSRR